MTTYSNVAVATPIKSFLKVDAYDEKKVVFRGFDASVKLPKPENVRKDVKYGYFEEFKGTLNPSENGSGVAEHWS